MECKHYLTTILVFLCFYAIATSIIIFLQVPSDDTDITDNSPFLLSASTESQVKLLRSINKPEDLLFHVEGPHRLWLRKIKQHYFSLKLSRRDTTSLLKDEGVLCSSV